jgi:hypothetical protein
LYVSAGIVGRSAGSELIEVAARATGATGAGVSQVVVSIGPPARIAHRPVIRGIDGLRPLRIVLSSPQRAAIGGVPHRGVAPGCFSQGGIVAAIRCAIRRVIRIVIRVRVRARGGIVCARG